MRIGLIADIHGNLVALDTILAELARDGVAEIVCLGDVAALGPQPRAVIARLRTLGCPIVMGNTDAWHIGEPIPAGTSGPVRALLAWCDAQLTDADRAFIRTFPPTITLPLGEGQTLLAMHGSPQSPEEIVVATTPEDDLARMLGGADATLYAGGHTHIPLVRRHGDARIVNPGSVGLPGVGAVGPYNRGVRWAEYAVLDVDGDRTEIALRRTPLDLPALRAAARASDMPEYDWWLSLWGR